MTTYKEFEVIRRRAKKTSNKEAAWIMVQAACHNLVASRREVNLAMAWSVWFELRVQPEHVSLEDASTHLQVIGSNGKKNMPIRPWEHDG